jgi:glycosyltransferase 2 family protein
MKHSGAMLAIAGLALAAILFARENVGAIVDLLSAAGPGLVLASVFHVVPMVANALAWQPLLPPPQRPGLRILAWATWIRESVNGLLPVARIGGEIVAYRIVRGHVAHRSEAAASLVADMTLSVLSQAGFALFGLALLFAIRPASPVTTPLVAALVGMIPLAAGFVLAQRAGVLGALTRCLDKLLAGRFRPIHAQSLRFDQALRAVYMRRGDIGACFAWQLAGWMLGAGEIWLALHFLGQPRGILDAVMIEALIQAISSAAFIVPGALGVQEGGFVLICAALGIDHATALALATARRLRDVIIFFPGLIAWQWAETRSRSVRSARASPSP